MVQSTRACWGIVIVHAVVFLIVALASDPFDSFAAAIRLDPTAMVQEWEWYRLLTASFVTDTPWHMVFSLLLIWVVGLELETQLGSARFVVLYLLLNLLGNLAQFSVYATHLVHPFPLWMLGPSAAAMGLAAAAIVQSPYRTVTYLFVPMQFWIFGLLVLLLDILYFMQGLPAWLRLAVHGPTLLAVLAYHQFSWRLAGVWSWPRLNRRATARRQLSPVLQSWRSLPQTRENETSEAGGMPRPVPLDEQLEAKMDALLEKVSKSGMGSLTEEEKQVLQRASQEMRRRHT
jgi:membrane associated rhomboid family serine protease